MVQVFVYCERNAKGAIVEIKKTNTVEEFKAAIRAQQVPILLRFFAHFSLTFCSLLLTFAVVSLILPQYFRKVYSIVCIVAHLCPPFA